MDSEMYSDFTGTRIREMPFPKPIESKKEAVWQKGISDSLEKIFDKVSNVDVNVGKRFDALAASISESKNATEKIPDVHLQSGSDLHDVMASEVSQLLSDVEELRNQVGGQAGAKAVDVEGKLNSFQSQIDSMKFDIQGLKENLSNVLAYFKARKTPNPMSLKYCNLKDGKVEIKAVPSSDHC